MTLTSLGSSAFVAVRLQAVDVETNRSVGHLHFQPDTHHADVTVTPHTCSEVNDTLFVEFKKPLSSAEFLWVWSPQSRFAKIGRIQFK